MRGLKFSIPVIFGYENFDLRGYFFAYSKQSEVAFCIMSVMKQKMFLGVSSVVSKKALTNIRHRYIFFFFGGGGVNFCAGIFGVLLETLLVFFGGGGRVDFCPHSSIPVT